MNLGLFLGSLLFVDGLLAGFRSSGSNGVSGGNSIAFVGQPSSPSQRSTARTCCGSSVSESSDAWLVSICPVDDDDVDEVSELSGQDVRLLTDEI